MNVPRVSVVTATYNRSNVLRYTIESVLAQTVPTRGARDESRTRGPINEFRFGTNRPALVCVPPRVWHGVQNIGPAESVLLNLVDRAYDYEDPDRWRLPVSSPQIPFSF